MIHFSSFIRAGTAAAVIAGLFLLISLSPLSDGFIAALIVIGLLLVPLGAGMYYGYLAPGREGVMQAGLGGALSGAVGGLVLGIAVGINQFMVALINTSSLGMSIVSSTAVILLVAGILAVLGAILGGIGGVLWPLIQDHVGN